MKKYGNLIKNVNALRYGHVIGTVRELRRPCCPTEVEVRWWYRPLSKLRISHLESRDIMSLLAKHLVHRVQYGRSLFYFKPSGVRYS